MTIKKYEQSMYAQFGNLLADYFAELEVDIPSEIVKAKLLDFICDEIRKDVICASFIFKGDVPAGFSIYQIDHWCKRPGWGFIREFYICPEYRRHGLGRYLAGHTEAALYSNGARRLYLTSDAAQEFWISCGWKRSESIESNGLPVLEK